jgi:alpha-L-fucosidase 2
MKTRGITMALCFLVLQPVYAAARPASELISFKQPALDWVEALPVGNGRLGAMVFGGTAHERLQLNEITVRTGGPHRDSDRQDAYKALRELRELLAEGKYDVAE